MSQLVIPGSVFPALPEALRASYEAAAAHVRDPHSDNTKAAYRQAWVRWAAHCANHPEFVLEPLPIVPIHLVAYLQGMVSSAPNSVRLELAALCSLDQAHALAVGDLERMPLRRTMVVQRWLKGWSRNNPSAPRKRAPALTVSDLGRVLQLAAEPGRNASRVSHVALYARDRCFFLMGIAGGFRVSEVCSLELADVTPTTGGLSVYRRRGKNDQQGKGHTRVLFPQALTMHCPVQAFEQWARLRGSVPGPLFCPILRTGLLELGTRFEESAAMRMVTRRCAAAGLEHVTSHSLRATFYTLTKRRPLSDVMAHVDSKSAAVALGYQRQAKLFDPESNPSSGLLE